MVKAEACFSYY